MFVALSDIRTILTASFISAIPIVSILMITKELAGIMSPPTSASQHGLANTSLLEKIDKLFECGVGDLVDLPRIVVVVDQSSGKSSVLEGLVNKPFPRDSGLCTRFATQFVFRRSNVERISVSIISDANASAEQRALEQQWGHGDLDSLDSSTFTKVMKEVSASMQSYNSQHTLTGLGPRRTRTGTVWRDSYWQADLLRQCAAS